MSETPIIRSRAKRDIEGCRKYISDDNPAPGRRFIIAVRREIERLAAMPGIGALFESDDALLASLRLCPVRKFENYLVFYRETTNGIEVVRVIHGGMDLETELGRHPLS